MTCPQCGSSNSDSRASCFACGATLGYNPSTLLAAQKGFRSPLYIIAMVFFGIHALFQFLGLIDGLERLEFVFDYMFDRDFFNGFNMFSNYLYSIAAIVFFVGMLVVVCSAGRTGHAVCMAGLITWRFAFSYQILYTLINMLDSYYTDEEDILALLLVFALATVDASVQYPMVTGGVMIVSTVICYLQRKKPTVKELLSVALAFLGTLALFLIPV